jgi:hypothetical protein
LAAVVVAEVGVVAAGLPQPANTVRRTKDTRITENEARSILFSSIEFLLTYDENFKGILA